MKNPMLCVCTVVLATGCATQGKTTVERIPATPRPLTYEKKIAEPQSVVWDRLVKNMAKSFFVINNIDKESRIINLSYSSDKPQEYVDCGRSKRTYSDGKTTESYEYGFTDNIAKYKSSSDKQSNPNFSTVGVILRRATLDGRANVYVAPEDASTLISVNAKSVVKINLSGEMLAMNFAGNVVNRQGIPPVSADVTAVTKGGTESTVAVGSTIETVTCYSTGKLEQAILDLAN
jgi:hypothetical protein